MNTNDYIKKNIANFYTQILLKHGITSEEELTEAINSGKISIDDFKINIDKIISPERQREVEEQNPDFIDLNGKSRKVDYAYNPSTKEFSANILITINELNNLTSAPTLPSGRTLTLKVSKDLGGPVLFTGQNLEELKKLTVQKLYGRGGRT